MWKICQISITNVTIYKTILIGTWKYRVKILFDLNTERFLDDELHISNTISTCNVSNDCLLVTSQLETQFELSFWCLVLQTSQNIVRIYKCLFLFWIHNLYKIRFHHIILKELLWRWCDIPSPWNCKSLLALEGSDDGIEAFGDTWLFP